MNKVLKSLSLFLIIVLLCGCYNKEERELAQKYREMGKQNAINYITQKYGKNPEIIKVKEIKSCGTMFGCLDASPSPTVEVKAKLNGKKFTIYARGDEKTTNASDDYQYDEIENDIMSYFEDKFKAKHYSYQMKLKNNGIQEYYEKDMKEAFKILESLYVYYIKADFSSFDLNSIDEVNAHGNSKLIFIKLYNFKTTSDYRTYRYLNKSDLANFTDVGEIYLDSEIDISSKEKKLYSFDYITNYRNEVYIDSYKDKTKYNISTSTLDPINNYIRIHPDLEDSSITQVSNAYSISHKPESVLIYFNENNTDATIKEYKNIFVGYECFKNDVKKNYIAGYIGKEASSGVGKVGDYFAKYVDFDCDSDSEISFALFRIIKNTN